MIRDRLLNISGFIFVITIFFSCIIHINASTSVFEESINDFPNDYKPYLQSLHLKYPNWEFKPLYINLDFNKVVKNESTKNRSLVPINSSNYIKSNKDGDYVYSLDLYVEKDKGWVSTTTPIVEYFINPVNFLNEKHIFQFEDLTYDENIQTKEGVENILKGTFMYNTKISYINLVGDIEKTERTYSDEIMTGAITYGINPYFLASKIRQEVGKNGSGSSSGNYLGFQGIYNFYNINAFDSENPIANGLKWAGGGTSYQRPWVSPSLSIVGGAGYISDKFIGKGQYTSYLQRFNVSPSSEYKKYTHQYMTNIAGASSESLNNYKAYLNNNMLNSSKIFWIPVYKNYDNKKSVKINNKKSTATLIADTTVRKGAGISYDKIDTLNKNTKVNIINGSLFTEKYSYNSLIYPYFYKISYIKDNVQKEGYVFSDDISLDESLTLKVGDKIKLDVIKTGTGNLEFQSSNRVSASVDEKGNVSALDEGTSEIRVYFGMSMDTIKIKVVK